jgi:hypothetical protein
MTQGRTPNPDEAIDRLDGLSPEKERLKVILEQVSGSCSVEEACERLGVGRTRYFELRQQALQGALEGLEPGVAGRPRTVEEIDPDDVDALVERTRELEHEMKVAEAKIELAMEGVLVEDPKKKGDPITTAKRKLRKEQRKSRQRNRKK